jgi:hypothetical protein
MLSRQFAELQHVVVEEFDLDIFATHPLQHPFELRCRVLPMMSFPGRLAVILLLQRLEDRLPTLERSAIPVARDVRGVEGQEASASNRTMQRLEQRTRCVRNVLDHGPCQHDVELAELRARACQPEEAAAAQAEERLRGEALCQRVSPSRLPATYASRSAPSRQQDSEAREPRPRP